MKKTTKHNNKPIPNIRQKTLKQLLSISVAILSMRGRVTMLGISRWGEHYSYKTIERFFDKKFNWLSLKWYLVKQTLSHEVILVADETTVSKSGKSTYGVDYFYSGVYNRAIRGLSFLSFALVDVKDRKSYPLFTRQMEKAKKEVQKKKNQKQKEAWANSQLFFSFDGEQKQRGGKRIYDDSVDYDKLDEKYLKETKEEKKNPHNLSSGSSQCCHYRRDKHA